MKKITKLTLLLGILFISNQVIAQIPNAGFETWNTVGAYITPDKWDNLNALTTSSGIYTCTQGSPGNPGSYYLKLTSKTIGPMVAPGIAVAGTLNTSTYKPKSGFPFTGQPTSLTGNIQYMQYGSGVGFIDIALTKWNSIANRRDTIAKAHKPLPGMLMSWSALNMTINYMSSLVPDSASIFLSASGLGPTNNDYLYVDNLAFSGNAAGIGELNESILMSVYPNPANDVLNISFQNKVQSISRMEVYSLEGQLIMAVDVKTANSSYTLDLTGLSRGVYFLKVASSEGITCKKFIKQ